MEYVEWLALSETMTVVETLVSSGTEGHLPYSRTLFTITSEVVAISTSR